MDQISVHTFDEGGVTLQAMVNGAPSGAPIPVPCDFDPAFVDQAIEDGMTVLMQRIVADIHYGDLPDGTVILPGWRLLIVAGPNEGTYVVDSLEPNKDKTGVQLRLKRP